MSEHGIRHNPDLAPAEGDDAVAFMAERLRENEGVQAGGYESAGVAIYEGTRPAEHARRYVIVRELAEAGGRPEHHTGRDEVPVQVVTSCSDENRTERKWHATMHRRIRAALENQTFERGQSATEQPIRRTHKPARSAFPTGTGQSEQIAQYAAPLLPKNSPYLS